MVSSPKNAPSLSYDDLQQAAAQLSMRLSDPPRTMSNDDTLVRGFLFQRELQPGLHAVGADVSYQTDLALEQEIQDVICCWTKIAGDSQTLQVDALTPMNVVPNQSYLISAGGTHLCRGRSQAGVGMTTAGFVLYREWIDGLGADPSLGSFQSLFDAGGASSVLQPLRGLARLAGQMRQPTYSGRLFDLLCDACIFAAIVELTETIGTQSGGPAPMNGRPYRRARAAREILDARIADPPSIAELSANLAINATTLRANFRAVFGMSIFDYVRSRRLEVARLMVRDGDLPIGEIGYRVGFSNPSAFSAAYRRRFGRSPGAERTA